MTEAAVRGRIKRGTLRSHRDAGSVYVVLAGDEPTPNRDEPDDAPPGQSGRVEDLREQVAYLRRQLDEEREARRRADTILAQLSAANAEQARTIRAIEAPAAAQEPPEDAETVEEEEPEVVEPRSDAGGAKAGAQRPWWRRVFGG